MSKPILVGLAPERDDVAPLTLGAALARATGAPLIALAAYVHDPVAGAPVDADLRSEALRGLEALTAGSDADLLVAGGPSPARVLHEAAERLDAALIVVGSTHKGPLGRLTPGTTCERLLRGAPCPVAVTPSELRAGWEPRRIGVGFVDNAEGHAALRAGAALARATGAALQATTAVEPVEWTETALVSRQRTDAALRASREQAERELDAALTSLEPGIRASSIVVIAHAADALIERSRNVDLVVCGSRGHGPLHSVLVGRVTHRLLRHADCPVLLVPGGVQEGHDDLAEHELTPAR